MRQAQPRLMVLGGPNLGRLGRREPQIYGAATWQDIQQWSCAWGQDNGYDVIVEQKDGEGDLVKLIHQAADTCQGLVLNAAAYTHTSVALRDAVASLGIPCVEWHLSNPTAREEFRQTNFLCGVVTAGVFGMGARGVLLALDGLKELLKTWPEVDPALPIR